METTMILTNKTAVETNTDKNGKEWRKCIGVFETVEHYPKVVAVTFLNQMIPALQKYQRGQLVKVKMDAESRLYEGRYYTELRAWAIKPAYEVRTQEQVADDAKPQTVPSFDQPIDPL